MKVFQFTSTKQQNVNRIKNKNPPLCSEISQPLVYMISLHLPHFSSYECVCCNTQQMHRGDPSWCWEDPRERHLRCDGEGCNMDGCRGPHTHHQWIPHQLHSQNVFTGRNLKTDIYFHNEPVKSRAEISLIMIKS